MQWESWRTHCFLLQRFCTDPQLQQVATAAVQNHGSPCQMTARPLKGFHQCQVTFWRGCSSHKHIYLAQSLFLWQVREPPLCTVIAGWNFRFVMCWKPNCVFLAWRGFSSFWFMIATLLLIPCMFRMLRIAPKGLLSLLAGKPRSLPRLTVRYSLSLFWTARNLQALHAFFSSYLSCCFGLNLPFSFCERDLEELVKLVSLTAVVVRMLLALWAWQRCWKWNWQKLAVCCANVTHSSSSSWLLVLQEGCLAGGIG